MRIDEFYYVPNMRAHQYIFVISLVVNLLMAISSSQRTLYLACLISVILLVGMHLATAAKGYIYFIDVVEARGLDYQVTYKTYEARLILGMAAACLTFVTNVVALLLLFKPNQTKNLLHVVVFNLVIEVGMGLITAMSIYEMKITRDFYYYKLPNWDYWEGVWDKDGFNLFWRMLIADGILTFVPQILGLTLVYRGVAKAVEQDEGKSQISSDGLYNKM